MGRLLRTVTTGALMTLVLTATAQAVTLQTTDTTRPWQTWANASEAPTWNGTLPLTVDSGYFTCGGMSDAEGCTSITPAVDQTTGQIIQGPPAEISTEVDSGPNAFEAHATLYHELGQVFWAEYMTPQDEALFMQIIGLNPDPNQWGNWLYGTRRINGVVIHFPPFEWFAEGYRYCATYGINQPSGVNDEEGLGYPGDQPSFAAQQRKVCQLIDRVGVTNGIAVPAQTLYQPPLVPTHKATKPRRHRRYTWGRRRVW